MTARDEIRAALAAVRVAYKRDGLSPVTILLDERQLDAMTNAMVAYVDELARQSRAGRNLSALTAEDVCAILYPETWAYTLDARTPREARERDRTIETAQRYLDAIRKAVAK